MRARKTVECVFLSPPLSLSLTLSNCELFSAPAMLCLLKVKIDPAPSLKSQEDAACDERGEREREKAREKREDEEEEAEMRMEMMRMLLLHSF